MIKLVCSIFVLIGGSHAWSKIEPLGCEIDLAALTILSADEREAIEVAAAGKYSIDIMTKTIGDLPRLVVLVGERHLKTQEEHAALVPLLKTIRNRAVELAGVSGYWMSGHLEREVQRLTRTHLAEKPLESVRSADDVINMQIAENLEAEVLEEMSASVAAGRTTLAKALSDIENAMVLRDCEPTCALHHGCEQRALQQISNHAVLAAPTRRRMPLCKDGTLLV